MKYLTLLLLAAVIGCSETARGLNDGIVDASQATVDGVADAPWGGLQIQSVGTPLEDSDQIVVLLHGYGATESDLIPLAGYIGGDRRAFVFPAGPVSVDGGGLAWGTTEAELRTAHARLAALVRFVSQTYPNAEIAVGGFSQGATLSSLLLSDSTLPIQHLILYSPAFVLEAGTLDPARDIHVLLAHGRRDEVLPFTDSKLMQEMLESEGVQTNWLPFDDGHTITTEVLDATRDQLSK